MRPHSWVISHSAAITVITRTAKVTINEADHEDTELLGSLMQWDDLESIKITYNGSCHRISFCYKYLVDRKSYTNRWAVYKKNT